ncbi:hypothetical protein Esi_0183_0066 [Ectocarpus siliculosus]|uniref:Uncharacterized protein n=1 Tax=Ectocarpus siliculosus TaxID=2880 RepID=D7FP00_ECTSI|nr:hypothetical protein Esi_0183_0066 [Ectocarpus siliculosus]|eukprot:CBJ30269.1 hypothetical protein Esi_0183_0066 [Ectocarpus siliculosus]
MSTVDLSSKFQAQVAVSGAGAAAAAAEGSFVGGGGAGAPPVAPLPPHGSGPNSATAGAAPPPSVPPGAFGPGAAGPSQPPPAEQTGKKFKLIKPDGFHSSASDKVLQARNLLKLLVDSGTRNPEVARLSGRMIGSMSEIPYVVIQRVGTTWSEAGLEMPRDTDDGGLSGRSGCTVKLHRMDGSAKHTRTEMGDESLSTNPSIGPMK